MLISKAHTFLFVNSQERFLNLKHASIIMLSLSPINALQTINSTGSVEFRWVNPVGQLTHPGNIFDLLDIKYVDPTEAIHIWTSCGIQNKEQVMYFLIPQRNAFVWEEW